MSADVTIDSKQYISSKRASEMTGYAQDYIGQLARSAQINARRIGGLWYISSESLLAYQNKAEEHKPPQPAHDEHSFPDAEAFVHLDGKEYISANRASKLTGYNQDYVGQLARSGKIVSRQVGNRWYLDKDALLAHKKDKDTLLGAVQTESVGIKERDTAHISERAGNNNESLLKYTNEEGDLLPAIIPKSALFSEPHYSDHSYVIPIRVVNSSYSRGVVTGTRDMSINTDNFFVKKSGVRIHGKTISRAILPMLTLTIVVALSFSLVSLQRNATYTLGNDQHATSTLSIGRFGDSSLVAGAAAGFEHFISVFEELLTTEEVYRR